MDQRHKRETTEDGRMGTDDENERKRKKKSKKAAGKACVYCRRSHMVCEGGRPCERCIKRNISHLCRDFTPPRQTDPSLPPNPSQSAHAAEPSSSSSQQPQPDFYLDSNPSANQPAPSSQYPELTLSAAEPSSRFDPKPVEPGSSAMSANATGSGSGTGQIPLYSDANFPPAWPLLTDENGQGNYGDNKADGEWGAEDDTELGALSKFLGDLGVPNLPGGFLDVLSYFSNKGTNNLAGVPLSGYDNPTDHSDAISMLGPMDEGDQPDFMPRPSVDRRNGSSSGLPLGHSPTTLADYAAQAESERAAATGSRMLQHSEPMQRTNSNGRGSGVKGKGKDVQPGQPLLGNLSRIERYFLAAADQPSGPRSSRLAQVIKAKYDAGLLKPYDYVKGYERMKGWMDSGRANPRAESVPASAPGSPGKAVPGARGGMRPLTAVHPASHTITPQSHLATAGSSKGISADSRRRIWAAMNGFRPKFRQIARTLDEVDLVFIEEAMERWMLQYDRAFASIHTPSCIWRRTGEIQKANQEFANLTGIPASMFRNGQLCVYELMDEDSAVRYWEGYAKIAFDAGQRSLYTSCTLKIPTSLTRLPPRQPFSTPPLFGLSKAAAPGPSGLSSGPTASIPNLSLPQSLINTANGAAHLNNSSDHPAGGGEGTPVLGKGTAGGAGEEYREIKCCFSVTIRRDAWGVPVAIMGQWIPI